MAPPRSAGLSTAWSERGGNGSGIQNQWVGVHSIDRPGLELLCQEHGKSAPGLDHEHFLGFPKTINQARWKIPKKPKLLFVPGVGNGVDFACVYREPRLLREGIKIPETQPRREPDSGTFEKIDAAVGTVKGPQALGAREFHGELERLVGRYPWLDE